MVKRALPTGVPLQRNSQRCALRRPFERQARIGNQLARREAGWLAAVAGSLLSPDILAAASGSSLKGVGKSEFGGG